MITIEQAKKIGITWCVDQVGREFIKKYEKNSSIAFSEDNNQIFCFIGVSDKQDAKRLQNNIVLSSLKANSFPYRASCYVSMANGEIKEIEIIKPQRKKQK